MSGTTHHPDSLNQAAAHDTGLYDPAVHDNQIVALYDTDADARTALQTLRDAGFSDSRMQVHARAGEQGASSAPVGDTSGGGSGFWGAIRSLFVPDEDRTTYNHAIARGHAMLIVTPDHTMDRHHLIKVLESTHPLDFDAKLEEWRQAGYDTTGTAAGEPTSNTATAGHAVDAGLNTTAQPPTSQDNGRSPDSIKLTEDPLRVGKREVNAGAGRVRSYIVDRPVQETVRPREDDVSVDRRPVDRPATPGDFGAVQERTIEARATSEEPVISKETRIMEEIGLTKEATDGTEPVRDTVRNTDVENDATSRTGSLPGSTNGNPNATPAAGTSGANTPRK